MTDISTNQGNVDFNYRIAAVIFHDGRVLLHRAEPDVYWALPGGRAALMEAATDSLRRELREELGCKVAVGRLLWVMENISTQPGPRFHELGLYFLARLPEGFAELAMTGPFYRAEALAGGGEIRHVFQWFPCTAEALAAIDLRPARLRAELGAGLEGILEHSPKIKILSTKS